MKSLLISENENHTSLLFSALTESGIETIRYRWFLKALDNIEEISPDFIMIDADDFPRHWKILCAYTKSAVFEKPMKIVLYSEKGLSEAELKTSRELDVFKTIVSSDKDNIKSELESLFENIPAKSCSGTDYFLPTVDSIFSGEDFLVSVDNLFENEDFEEDGFIQDLSLKGENSECLDDDFEEDDEVPTVDAVFNAHNIKTPFSDDLTFSSDGNAENHQLSEEDIQNEYSLYSVDSLFGLEENGYPIYTVDNLFYVPDGYEENLPKNESQCKKLLGSLLRRIQEFYEE